MASALTSLQTNTAALKVVSQNIANLNTDNYVRREVNLSALGSAGLPSGVTIDDVTRVTNQYLMQESLSATAASAQYDTTSGIYDQINALLGSPGDGNSVSSQLSNVFTKLGAAQLSTATNASQASVVSAMNSLASTISSMSNSLDGLATQADQQLSTSVSTASSLIKQIYDYNKLIKAATLQGDTDTTYLDQRDSALKSLAQQMDIRVSPQDDGTVQVSTQDGLSLVGAASYATLGYTTGADGVYNSITAQDTNGTTGQPIGTVQLLDSHLTGGAMRGLLDVRDNAIASVKNELGSLAQNVANAFNQIHNASSAYPPPDSLTGRNTGLLASDSLNFSGQSRIVLTNATGAEQHTVDIDFDAGTISVDGGSAAAFGNTVGGFATTLNTAMASVGGSASFSDGSLSISGGSSGVVVGDPDSTNPSSRGGTGFSQFFGLNDLFTSSVPTITNTGMTGSDALGLSADGTISFVLKNADGSVAAKAKVTITAGMTVSQALTAVNSQLSGYATLSLDANGAVKTTLNNAYSGYSLQVTDDSTQRGTTGMSISNLFGLGSKALGNIASGFKLTSAISSSPSLIAFAKPDLSGTQTVGAGDSNGLLAMQGLATQQLAFEKVGNLGKQTASLQNYAASLYQDIATQASSAATAKTTQTDRLTEAQSRLSNLSGVNLDEELSNMIMYQKAYSAGARLLTTVNQLYDALFSIQ
jgi:flagellar hook-associated protein 1 FlgK